MDILTSLKALGILPVVKLEHCEDALPLADTLDQGGLPCAEITFRTDAAADAIAAIRSNKPDMIAGAGTVTSIAQAGEAVSAGAQFIVTPGFNAKVVSYCIEKGIPIIPGCPTSSDIECAREMGLHCLKLFPAEAMGGVKLIRALSAPYSDITFVPTGGISAENIRDYLSVPKVAFCGGSWMVPADAIANRDFAKITSLTRKAIQAAFGFAIHHIAFNCEDAQTGSATAQAFTDLFGWEHLFADSADHAGTWIESMKVPGIGQYGHIAVSVYDIPRAKAYMQMRGVRFLEQTAPQVCNLDHEIRGFGLQIVDPKLM